MAQTINMQNVTEVRKKGTIISISQTQNIEVLLLCVYIYMSTKRISVFRFLG